MSVEIKIWDGERRWALAQMFARAFAHDQAMVSLVNANEDNAVERLTTWFDLTLNAWPPSQVLVAYEGGEFVAGTIFSLGNHAPPLRFLLRWFWQQWRAFGFNVPLHMVQHERKRFKIYPRTSALVIEFVAVDQRARGKGLARRLFDAAYGLIDRPANVALETGNPQNVVIYQHMGYQVVARYEDDGVEYVVMTKSLSEET
jgi:GNAT superfamily N-acetyltransferase